MIQNLVGFSAGSLIYPHDWGQILLEEGGMKEFSPLRASTLGSFTGGWGAGGVEDDDASSISNHNTSFGGGTVLGGAPAAGGER